MINGPSFRTPVEREIAEAVNSSAISAGIESKMGGFIAHDISPALATELLATVARDKKIKLYLGHGNYIINHDLLDQHPTTVGDSINGPEAIGYNPKGGAGRAPRVYRPGGCADDYCGQR